MSGRTSSLSWLQRSFYFIPQASSWGSLQGLRLFWPISGGPAIWVHLNYCSSLPTSFLPPALPSDLLSTQSGCISSARLTLPLPGCEFQRLFIALRMNCKRTPQPGLQDPARSSRPLSLQPYRTHLPSPPTAVFSGFWLPWLSSDFLGRRPLGLHTCPAVHSPKTLSSLDRKSNSKLSLTTPHQPRSCPLLCFFKIP